MLHLREAFFSLIEFAESAAQTDISAKSLGNNFMIILRKTPVSK
jgi:hypothetical protein